MKTKKNSLEIIEEKLNEVSFDREPTNQKGVRMLSIDMYI